MSNSKLVLRSMSTELAKTATETAAPPGKRAQAQDRKRRQILDAAASVFRRLGYDGASMNDVASEAGVSKPTLYVYFQSKEGLFQAIIDDMREAHPELMLGLDPGHADMAGQMETYAFNVVRLITAPKNMAIIRMVIGATEKFPEVGRRFFESGPRKGHARVETYIAAKVASGDLAVDDVDLAAWQFIDLIQSPHQRMCLTGIAPAPSDRELRRTVKCAVAAFLAAHRP